jgi:hypothetical protein
MRASFGWSAFAPIVVSMNKDRASAKPLRIASAILSDGTMLEAIQEQPASNTRFSVARGNDVTFAADWTSDGIRYAPISSAHNLIKHKAIRLPGIPAEYVSAGALYAEIIEYACKYVSLTSQFLAIAASYTLLSWVYDAFNELPYLRFRGDYGSGKTRALTVFGSIAYKGFFASGASTVSPIFDEADFRFTDEKAELVKILNNGNVKGFPVLRTQVTASKEFEPRAFTVFGPKIVAMRGSYQDRALESRFLTGEMSGQSMGSDIPISLPVAQENEAHALRSKLLMYRLREREHVAIDPHLADPNLEPRMNQILLPLLSVAPSNEARQAILSYASQMQQAVVSDRNGSIEGQLLTVIAEIGKDAERLAIPLKQIVSAFTKQFGEEHDRPISSRFLGGILRNRLGLPMYKTNGTVAVSLQHRSRLTALLTRYGIDVDDGNARQP